MAWSSSALPKIEEEIVLGEAKNWVVSIFMIGAAIVPWFAGLSFTMNVDININNHLFQQSHST